MDQYDANRNNTNVRLLSIKPRLLKYTRSDAAEQKVTGMSHRHDWPAETSQLQTLSRLRDKDPLERILSLDLA